MKQDLLKIINNYGVMSQLKYFQSEVFELNEAIIKEETKMSFKNTRFNNKHITEEIADVLVMLKQFQYYYKIEDKEIEEVMKYKIERQLKRIEEQQCINSNQD